MRVPRDMRVSRVGDDRGAAIAEFAMVTVALVFLLFAVVQVAGVFYVKSVVASAASDGARFGAVAGADPVAGAARASAMISRALSTAIARQVPCRGALVVDGASGLAASQVSCGGRIRSIFLPIGAFVDVRVSGQSLKERP